MTDGTKVALLSRAEDALIVVPGSVQVTANCGCNCWISPSIKSVAEADPSVSLMCTQCAGVESFQDLKKLKSVRLAPGQKKALKSVLGRKLTRQVLRELKRKEK